MKMATTSYRGILFLCSIAALTACAVGTRAESPVFESAQITPSGEYTFGIEGPAVDEEGNLFVVNFARPGTIGWLRVGASSSELFAQLPEGSVGNSIRFRADGAMFIADYKKHIIFTIAKGSREPQVYFQSDQLRQPNDMTIANDGTIYASDPYWKERTGKIWRIYPGPAGAALGEAMTAPRKMGTTNGIDLSPDGKTLYVGESDTGEIWSYRTNGNDLEDPRLVKKFEPNTIDGIRTDVDGRLFVARILKGKITMVGADGALVRDVTLKGSEPTNLAFGGGDGKKVLVTQRKGGFVESFITDRAGREFCLPSGRC